MAAGVVESTDRRHHTLRDLPAPRMAKADLTAREIDRDARKLVGFAIERACSLIGWTKKELAGRLDKDHAQVSRWMSGDERPHFDALFALEEFRQPLAVSLAELAECEIETVIRIRRHPR